jgi:hypothetical protein
MSSYLILIVAAAAEKVTENKNIYSLPEDALAKLSIDNNCHSERSEESRIFKRLRSFTSFRMTKKPVLQEAFLAIAII